MAAGRTPLIAGNWKMHLDHLEAIALVQQLAYRLESADFQAVEVVVVPPATALRSVQTLVEGDRLPIGLGGQTCHWEDAGAYTGEISPGMLAALKVRYVLCGHSERRALFGETDEIVGRKVDAVLRHGMVPVLCVGETADERDAGQADDVVVRQLRAGLAGVSQEQAATSLVVAYEPVWAIGTGRTALPDEAQEMCALVRQVVGDVAGQRAGDAVRVLYGGSVKAGNAAELLRRPDVDGALVGGASLDPEGFAVICRSARDPGGGRLG
jgi:triosephosphate isomerase